MYESFYGFKERPFSLLPDPTFLYLASQHSNALAMLEYGLASQAGFTVITGEIGCGKTTLIRHLLNNVDRDVTVGLLSNTQRSIGELLQGSCSHSGWITTRKRRSHCTRRFTIL
jgi:general secretion pathway protein A